MRKWHSKLTEKWQGMVVACQSDAKQVEEWGSSNVYISESAELIAFLSSMLDRVEDGLLPVNSPTQAPTKIRTIATILGYDGAKLAKGEIPE